MTFNLPEKQSVPETSANRSAYTVAAYIIHPRLSIPQDLLSKEISFAEVQRALVVNKVLFRSFAQHDSALNPKKVAVVNSLLSNSSEMKCCYDFYKVLKAELLDAIQLLNENDVQTVFIKSSGILPFDSDNFDLLIPDSQKGIADKVLRVNGFSFVKIAAEPFKTLYRKTEDGKDFLALHLHSRIAWSGVEFLKVEDVWKKYSTKDIEGTNVGFISPEHHALVTVAHAFFENGSLRLGDLMYLVDSLSNDDLDLGRIVSSSVEMGWDAAFCAMLSFANVVHRDIYDAPMIRQSRLDVAFSQALNVDQVKRVSDLRNKIEAFYHEPYLPVSMRLRDYRIRQLISQVASSDSLSLTVKVKTLKHLLAVFLKGIAPRQRASIVVSLVGMDSTGKTTHARKLVEAFNKRGYRAVHIWSRGAFRLSRPFTSAAASFLGSNSKTASAQEPSRTRAHRLRANPAFGKILTILLLLEYSAQLRWKLLLKRSSNNALIFDRYLYDTLVDSLLNYGSDYDSFFPRFLLSNVELFASRPDLIVVLKASPETVLRRSPEEDLSAARIKSRIYDQWSKRWGACILDTDRHSVEQNHLDLLGKTLRVFYEGQAGKGF